MDHDENVIAAAALAVADHVRLAIEQAAGRSGGAAAALTALDAWGDGHPIEELAAGLRLSHSRAVRIVDGLVADGLARRDVDRSNRRRVLVRLTAAGRTRCRRLLEAREHAVREVLAKLDERQRSALSEVAEALLGVLVSSMDDVFYRCRYCDPHACGHHEGRCPVTRKGASIAHGAR